MATTRTGFQKCRSVRKRECVWSKVFKLVLELEGEVLALVNLEIPLIQGNPLIKSSISISSVIHHDTGMKNEYLIDGDEEQNRSHQGQGRGGGHYY